MSEYKRLTENEFSCSCCKDRKCTIPDTYCYDRLRCEIYNRLAEIEEKLESRKLVELTYKKGDSVFFISWISGNVCEGAVVDWQEDGGYCIVGGDDMISAYECFSTKESAEARLKELQDKENCP